MRYFSGLYCFFCGLLAQFGETAWAKIPMSPRCLYDGRCNLTDKEWTLLFENKFTNNNFSGLTQICNDTTNPQVEFNSKEEKSEGYENILSKCDNLSNPGGPFYFDWESAQTVMVPKLGSFGSDFQIWSNFGLFLIKFAYIWWLFKLWWLKFDQIEAIY